MSINSVWISALDKRKDLVRDVQLQVKEYLNLPLQVFWSGDGTDSSIMYDRIDWPEGPELFRHCTYGQGVGRKNHANAFLSHREMFRKILSVETGENILIMEEDVYFIDDRWNTIFHSSLMQDFLRSDNWRALYLGWQQKTHPNDSDELNAVEDAWIEHRKFDIVMAVPLYSTISGLHAIVMKRSLIEWLAQAEVGPMDSILNRNLQRLKLYYVAPKIIGALDSFSQAEQRWQPRVYLR